MTRDKLIKLKEKAFDRMQLCYGVFAGNKPPRPEHAVELQAHAAFYQALCAELGEPVAKPKERIPLDVVEICAAALAATWNNSYSHGELITRCREALNVVVQRGDEHG